MSRPRRPTLPLRDGVGASCVAVPSNHWATVLDFLADRLPTLSRADWQARLQAGEVLTETGQAIAASAPCPAGLRIYYYRGWADEPAPTEPVRIVFQDEWLVVADKPHFVPVTPGGRFVRRSLLVQLAAQLGLDAISPLHRIDRETAGLVAFAVQPHTRAAYQGLFRDRAVHKRYEAVAPFRPNAPLPPVYRSRLQADPDRFFLSREVPGEPNSETYIDSAQRLPAKPCLALFSLRPTSGQRHQLRLHMNALGRAILGDSFYPRVLYAAEAPDDTARPLQLLARELAFTDPITGQARHFQSGLVLAATQGRWPITQSRD